MAELKPCPFCGSEAKYKEEKDHQYNYYTELVVGCTNSHCFCRYRKSLGVAPSEYLIKTQMDKMIEKWNKRMVEPRKTKQPEISSYYGLKSYVRERSE